MISAKEAAAIPSTAITWILTAIEMEIRRVRQDNEYVCWFTFSMSDETHVSEVWGILESLGYNVTNSTESSFSNTTIKIEFMRPTTEGDNNG